MALLRFTLSMMLTLLCGMALAATPTVNSPLPLLSIADRGELIMEGEDFSFVPWRSDKNPDSVHVVQYFGATQSDRDVFKPFTDLLQTGFEPGTVHVTTILNLDAALWGTSGFVLSELKKNKRIHPLASMVLDEKGTGVTEWGLGEAGTGLAIMDKQGAVKYFTKQSMDAAEAEAALQLMRSYIN